MMESIKQWVQDWSDACQYARECAPDLSFAVPREPYSALAGIAAACLLVWWWNERWIRRLHAFERRGRTKAPLPAVPIRGLKLMLDQMRSFRPLPRKQAA